MCRYIRVWRIDDVGTRHHLRETGQHGWLREHPSPAPAHGSSIHIKYYKTKLFALPNSSAPRAQPPPNYQYGPRSPPSNTTIGTAGILTWRDCPTVVIFCVSSSLSFRSSAAKYSFILSTLVVVLSTTTPRSSCQRISTVASLTPYLAAISLSVPSRCIPLSHVSGARPMKLWHTIPWDCSHLANSGAPCVYAWNWIWLTAGLISAVLSRFSIWYLRKLETPIALTFPERWAASRSFQTLATSSSTYLSLVM